MSLEAIEKEIDANAAKQAAALKKEAEEEASRIIEEAKKRAEQIVEDAKKSAEADAERLKKAHDAEISYEAESIISKARSEAVERELASIRKEVVREIDAHIGELVAKAAKEFAKVAPVEGATLELPKRHLSAAKAFGGKVAEKEINGFAIRSGDGKVALDGSIDSILDKYIPEIWRLVSDELSKGMQPGVPNALAPHRKSGRARAQKAKKAMGKR